MPEMLVKLEVMNQSAVISNLVAYQAGAYLEATTIVNEVASYVQRRTAERAAKDTGFMAEHVREWLSEKGLKYRVGWTAQDFIAAGKPFYPPYPEFGTSRQPAQPALIPSAREGEKMIRERITAMLRRRSR